MQPKPRAVRRGIKRPAYWLALFGVVSAVAVAMTNSAQAVKELLPSSDQGKKSQVQVVLQADTPKSAHMYEGTTSPAKVDLPDSATIHGRIDTIQANEDVFMAQLCADYREQGAAVFRSLRSQVGSCGEVWRREQSRAAGRMTRILHRQYTAMAAGPEAVGNGMAGEFPDFAVAPAEIETPSGATGPITFGAPRPPTMTDVPAAAASPIVPTATQIAPSKSVVRMQLIPDAGYAELIVQDAALVLLAASMKEAPEELATALPRVGDRGAMFLVPAAFATPERQKSVDLQLVRFDRGVFECADLDALVVDEPLTVDWRPVTGSSVEASASAAREPSIQRNPAEAAAMTVEEGRDVVGATVVQ